MNEFWNNRQVLVTGAGGFIGSHLVEALLRKGARVRAFVRYTSRSDTGWLQSLDPQPRLEITAGDLRDEHAVRAAAQGCDLVFHLGALISIPYSYVHPAEVAAVNFMGTLNVLLACREQGVKRLVHTSTSEVYGTARQTPIRESHPLQGQSPYSASKIGADKLVESFTAAYGLPAVTVRPFNTFGPRQSARAVIPTIITQALARDEVHLGSLTTTRDFTFVTDTVNGFLRAAETSGVEGEVFNLGTGQEISIGDLAHKVIARVGRKVRVVEDRRRLRPEASEVLRLVSDNSLAVQRLGWKPSVTLEEGLDRTIAWVRENLHRYKVGMYEF